MPTLIFKSGITKIAFELKDFTNQRYETLPDCAAFSNFIPAGELFNSATAPIPLND